MTDRTLPPALTQRQHWLNWAEGTKVPRPAINHRPLLSYEEACARDIDHVGFVFTEDDPYTGIDIDALTPFATEILRLARQLGAFVQRSPSMNGWHIIGRGRLRGRGIGRGSIDQGVECYSVGRYFTMPRNSWTGDPDVDIQPLIDRLETMRETGGQPSAAHQVWSSAEHNPALAAIPADDYETWVQVGMALKAGGAPVEVWDQWSATSAKYPGPEEIEGKWGSFKREGIGLGTVLMLGREHGWREGLDDFEVLPEPPPPAESAALDGNWWAKLALSAESMVTAPPPRAWAWDDMVPVGAVTGLAGEGGIAKSTLALQLAVEHVLGGTFLGAATAGKPAVFITTEDDGHELRRRLQAICAAQLLDPADVVGRLHLLPAAEVLPYLARVDREGKVKARPRLDQLAAYLLGLDAGLVVLDLVGDFWDGNENHRAEVTTYVRRLLGGVARDVGAGVLAIQHLNKAGEVSGSTAWPGSFRSQLTMRRTEDDDIELLRVKSNYARPQREGEGVLVRWSDGAIVQVTGAEREARAEQQVEALVAGLPLDQWLGVDAIREFWGLPRARARRRAGELVEEGRLEHRVHGGDQWRVRNG